ncbi:MAG TPA: hypothetical protein VKA27_14695 [Sunxiuqinia sp.]|nr:hypothetical protein [Sunxiuqinia sp.]
MKYWKFVFNYKLIAFTIVLIAGSSSCKKNNDFPAYVGDWVTQKPIPVATGFVSVNYYLKFSSNTFTESFIDVPRTPSYNTTRKSISIEGALSVSDSIMTLTANKIIFSNYDTATSTYSKPYKTFTRDKDDIDEMLSGFVLVTAGHEAKYSIAQDKLSIVVDYNRNGVFSDDYASFTYTSQ